MEWEASRKILRFFVGEACKGNMSDLGFGVVFSFYKSLRNSRGTFRPSVDMTIPRLALDAQFAAFMAETMRLLIITASGTRKK